MKNKRIKCFYILVLILISISIKSVNALEVLNTKTINGKQSDSISVGESFTVLLTVNTPLTLTYSITDKLPDGFSYILTAEEKDSVFKLYDKYNNVIATDNGRNSEGSFDLYTVSNNILVGNVIVDQSCREMTISVNRDLIDSEVISFEYRAQIDYTMDNEGKIVSGPIIGNRGNQTGAILSYIEPSNNQTVNIGVESASIKTYGIQVVNTDGKNPLMGAEFTVYRDSAATDVLGTIVIGNEGYGTIDYLKAGTYYLKQTKPPANFQVNSDLTSIYVGDVVADGRRTMARSIPNDYSVATVANTVAITLPYTGSMDTVLYIGVGVLFIIVSVVFMVLYKKKQFQN